MSLSTRAVTAKKIVKTPMLRNILIVSLVVAIAIPVVSAFWIIPAFTQQLTTRTEDQAVRTATPSDVYDYHRRGRIEKGVIVSVLARQN